MDALLYTVAHFGLPVVHRVTAEPGVDAAALETLYGALAEQAQDQGLISTEGQGSVAGALFAALSMVESNRYDFTLR